MTSPHYPELPGFKVSGTSEDAAESMHSEAKTLRDQVYALLTRMWPGGATADEIAASLKRTPLAIRPRVTELSTQSFIIDSGKRRKNISGRNAIVWKVPNQP